MDLRLVLITQGVSRIVAPLLASEFNVVGIVESAPRHYRQLARYQRLLTGRALYSRLVPSLARHASHSGIPYFLLHRRNDTEFRAWLRRLEPDVALVHSMSQLLTPATLSIPRFGILNLHPSILPAYRGPNPLFWMYHDFVRTSGVTLHFVDEGEDTGDIVSQAEFSIPLGMRSPEFLDVAIGDRGVELSMNALQQLDSTGTLPRTSSVAGEPNFACAECGG